MSVGFFKICISMANMFLPESAGWAIGDTISDKLQRRMAKFERDGKFQQIENAINKELDCDTELKEIISKISQKIYTIEEDSLRKKEKMKKQNSVLLYIKEGHGWEDFYSNLRNKEIVLSGAQKEKMRVLFCAVANIYVKRLGSEDQKTRLLISECSNELKKQLDNLPQKVAEAVSNVLEEKGIAINGGNTNRGNVLEVSNQ